MDNNVLVSIIIPVYNVEKYLDECIHSVINQTYKNIEIILINDGSTDSSLDICREYEKKDTRITVVNQKNHGQGHARNVGNDLAKGEFIAYVDSDDYVELTYIEDMLRVSILYKADLVQSGTVSFWGGTKKKEIDFNVKEIEIYSASEALREFCYQRKINPGPCGKLIRKSIMHGIRFPENVGYEDLGFVYKVIGVAKVIVAMPEMLYFYRQHASSTMHKGFSIKKIDRIVIAKEIVDYIKLFYPENENASKSRWLLANLQLLMDLPFSRQYANLKSEIKGNIKAVRMAVIKDNEAKMVLRVMALVSFWGINFLMIMGRIYKKIIVT